MRGEAVVQLTRLGGMPFGIIPESRSPRIPKVGRIRPDKNPVLAFNEAFPTPCMPAGFTCLRKISKSGA